MIGFDPATADRLVRQTIIGAAAMLREGKPPEVLRSAVTSKGGTTEAATRVLDESNVMGVFVQALTAARNRGRELGSS